MPAKTTTQKTTKSAKPAAAAKAAKAQNKPAAPAKGPAKRPSQERPVKKASGLDLAAKVLAEAGEPLAAKTIAERVIAEGWKTKGTTPNATIYSAIGREIAGKGKEARFRKTGRGLFAANFAGRKKGVD